MSGWLTELERNVIKKTWPMRNQTKMTKIVAMAMMMIKVRLKKMKLRI